MLGLTLASTAAQATTYTFTGNSFPACGGKTGSAGWSSATPYTCNDSISLASGDILEPSSTITVVANAGITLAGKNTIGSASALVNLQTASGSLVISDAGKSSVVYGSLTVGSGSISVTDAVVSGNVTAQSGSVTISNSTVGGTITTTSGAVTLTSVATSGNIVSGTGSVTLSGPSTVTGGITIGGSLTVTGGSVGGNVSANNGVTMTGATVFGGSVTSTNGPVSLVGGSVAGNVTGHKDVTTTSSTTIGGSVVSTNGNVSLSGGKVSGSVSSGCCTVTTYYTDIGSSVSTSAVSSSSSTVSITGGTIVGNITTTGGAGIVIKDATVTSTVISAGTNPVKISGSTVSGAISGGGADGVVITDSIIPSGSITATNAPIRVSDSTIGSPASAVNVSGNNVDYLLNNTTVYGNVTAGGWTGAMNIDGTSHVYGNCTPTPSPDLGQCVAFVPGPDHIRVFFNNTTALTCAPRTLDAIACKNSTCAARYASPVSVTLSPGGVAATIPAGGTGKPSVARTSEGAATITLAASNPAVTALRCYEGSVASPGSLVSPCNLTFSKSGFFVAVPDHVSGVTQQLTITAAKTDDKTKTCVPAFDSGSSRKVKLRFAYVNPTSGATSPVVPTVGANPPATPLSTTTDVSLNLAFTNGVAKPYFLYNDAGSLSVSASYTGSAATGDVGLNMATVSNPAFVVAPKDFLISGIPAAPLTAGSPFNITVTARNDSGATTANFGREMSADGLVPRPATALLTSSNPLPALGNATPISQALSGFTKGAASTTLTWNEVGTVDITATTSKYLASSLDVVGSRGAVGRFKPAYFDTIVSHGCSGVFTYAGLTTPAIAGQQFTVEVKAKRARGDSTDATNTANYAGTTWAKAVTLSDANGGGGTLANNTFAAAAFTAGKAKRSDVSYAMATKLTAPYTLAIRTTENPGGDGVSSSGHSEGSTLMRSGRLRLSNAYGSEKATLSLLVQAQYWSGYSWVQNSDDACTILPQNTFALFDPTGAVSTCSSVSGAVSWDKGQGNLVLNKPTGVCSIDVAANLGVSGNDQSCLASHGGSAANLPWLRSRNGSCASTYDRDPSARASFGIYSPELKKTVHIRELY